MTVKDDQATGDELETTADDTAAPADATTVTTDDSSAAQPTLADVISGAIEDAGKPRQIQPKQEEIDQDDTRPRNADGTFKAETDEEKTAREAAEAEAATKSEALKNETPEQKTAREAAEAAAAKKEPDAINDPIPEGLNKRTAERMKSLIDTVKAQEAIVESHTALFNIVQEAGSPDEFAAMVGYMRGIKSNDPKQLETAYQMLQSELKGLAVKMGKPLYEVNLLRDPSNKDLVDEIAAGTLSNPRAHELALQREALRQRQGADKQTTAAETAEQELTTGRTDLDTLEKELIKRDGIVAYKEKRTILESTLQATMAAVSPTKWKEIFTKAYEGLKIAPKPAPVVPHVEKQQPLRTKQPAGASGAAAAPTSALDAINRALGV